MTARRFSCGLSAFLLSGTTPVFADVDKEAATLQQQGNYSEAADTFIKDFRWEDALHVYQTQARAQPANPDAWLGIGRIRRWQGHLEESRQAYERAGEMAPGNADAALGLAATYTLDHDFAEARRRLTLAERQWPGNSDVREAAEALSRQQNPRIHAFFEDDLSFKTRQAGITVPFLSREEVVYEYGTEERPGSNIRRDNRLSYAHYFGLNHTIDFSVRQSSYSYDVPTTDFTAIDAFDEYRIRYTRPITPEQVVGLRWTNRPTTLKTSQARFAANKIEAELTSQWTPRLRTMLGTGVLRDLDGNAATTSDMRTTTLIKAGADFAATQQLRLSALYVTNPDLDNTVKDMRIAGASYQLTGNISAILRYRFDDYKKGSDQEAYYLGARFVPNGHLWTELGVKSVERGSRKGTYPLASMMYKF